MLRRLALFLALTAAFAQPAEAVITIHAVGAANGGVNAITITPPATHSANDVELLFVETSNEAASLSTAAGFAAVTGASVGTGTAAGADGTMMTVFWRRWNGTDGSPVLADSGNHQIGVVVAFSGVVGSGNPWDVVGTNTQTATASVSVSGVTTSGADRMAVAASGGAVPDAGPNSNTEFTSAANGNLTGVTEQVDVTDPAGNGGAILVITGTKAAAGATGATTATAGTSTNGTRANVMIALTPDTTTTTSTSTSSTTTSSTSTSTSTTTTSSTSTTIGAIVIGGDGPYLWGESPTFSDSSSGTSRDPSAGVLWEESDSDARISLCAAGESNCRVFAGNNGGSSAAKWAVLVNKSGSSQFGAYRLVLPTTQGLAQVKMCAAYHNVSIATAAVPFMSFREDRTSDGIPETIGAFARQNTDGTVSVYYNSTSNLVGTTTLTTQNTGVAENLQGYCVSSASTCDSSAPDGGDSDCAPNGLGVCISNQCVNFTLPCRDASVSTDCPSSQTCSECTAATGVGCYFPHICLIQKGGQVNLTWNDRQVVTGAISPNYMIGQGVVHEADWGVLNALNTSGQLTANMNALSLWNDAAVVWGFVHPVVPASGLVDTWTAETSGGGCTATTRWGCVDDPGVSPYTITGGDYFNTAKANRTEAFATMTPTFIVPTGGDIAGVDYAIVGGSNDDNTKVRSVRLGAGICPEGAVVASCAFTSSSYAAVDNNVSTPTQWARISPTRPPDGTQSWSPYADVLATRVQTNSTNTGQVRAEAMAANVYVARPLAQLPITIADHDVGSNDGQITLCSNGNSQNNDTLAKHCVGVPGGEDITCSQDTYCCTDGSSSCSTHDLPVGGCQLGGHECETCSLRKGEFGGGAGFPCGPNNGSQTCDLGACSANTPGTASGTCADAPEVTCDCTSTGGGCLYPCSMGTCSGCSNADCSGECTAGNVCGTGYCLESCPGGECPPHTAMGTYLANFVGADNVITYALGGETNDGGYARLPDMLAGNCTSLNRGIVTSGTAYCGCDANADCGTSGNCDITSHVCLSGGSATCTACGQCISSRDCQFPDCDLLVQIDEAVNDCFLGGNQSGGTNPNCQGFGSLSWTTSGMCSECSAATRDCFADATCVSGRGANSECLLGYYVNGTAAGDLCAEYYPGNPAFFVSASFCSIDTSRCYVDADCVIADRAETNNRTCVQPPDGTAGYCACASDADCPQNYQGNAAMDYKCSDGVCTLSCASSANCDGQTCGGTPQVCTRHCTCPSDSTSGTMPDFPNTSDCTHNDQCVKTISTGMTGSLNPADTPYNESAGLCIAGDCKCSGFAAYTTPDDQCFPAFLRLREGYATRNVVGIAKWKQYVDAINATDSDGGPILVWAGIMNTPEDEVPGRQGHCLDKAFIPTERALARRLFPGNYIDLNGAIADIGPDACYVDGIHPDGTCALAAGGVGSSLAAPGTPGIGEFVSGYGACVYTATKGTPQQRPRKYCRNPDNSYHSTNTCAQCTGLQRCEVRGCSTDDSSTTTGCPASDDGCNLTN